MKKAVECGYWNLFRFNPAAPAGKKFTLDSKEPAGGYQEFLMNEARYSRLTREFPERARSSSPQRGGRQGRYEHLLKLKNGRCSVRDVVRHCGAVAIVALTENGKIALVRQYRTALDRVTVEIPAGKMDPGEEPLDCAKRELKEETGFVAGRIAYLTTIATSGGFTDELIHIYLATQLRLRGPSPTRTNS